MLSSSEAGLASSPGRPLEQVDSRSHSRCCKIETLFA
jgi:hypothetical protein